MKYCYCISATCGNFFKGCSCLKGKCQTGFCPCFTAEKECDPDLCLNCEKHKKCLNQNILKGNHKHLFLGVSTIREAGWGIFVEENIKTNEFIAEYTGELLSIDEAERRGRVCDKKNCSYIFHLDSLNEIDAMRKGNKTRFINNSNKEPNCYPKIMMVNGEHRIGIYANKNILPNTELFYDYGYGKQVKVNNTVVVPMVTQGWITDKQLAGKIIQRPYQNVSSRDSSGGSKCNRNGSISSCSNSSFSSTELCNEDKRKSNKKLKR